MLTPSQVSWEVGMLFEQWLHLVHPGKEQLLSGWPNSWSIFWASADLPLNSHPRSSSIGVALLWHWAKPHGTKTQYLLSELPEINKWTEECYRHRRDQERREEGSGQSSLWAGGRGKGLFVSLGHWRFASSKRFFSWKRPLSVWSE